MALAINSPASIYIARMEACRSCDHREKNWTKPSLNDCPCLVDGRTFHSHVTGGDCPKGRYPATEPQEAADARTREAMLLARSGKPITAEQWELLPAWLKNRTPKPGKPAILRLADERRPICQKCERYRGDAGKTGVHCGCKGNRPCSNVVRLDGECPEGKWGTAKITPPVAGPVFCMANGEAVPGRHIRPTVGGSVFLLCSGPSLKTLDLDKLRQPGIRTMAVNNAAKLFRPDYWTHVDAADHFIRSIFLDDRIVKFSPYNLRNGRLFDSDAWQWTDTKVQDCPNVYFYRRHTGFNAETFLYDNSICWGNDEKTGGARSVMLVAIRILYELGYRRVYILGADFNMKTDYTYAFPQDRSDKSVSNNNYTYRILNERFKAARPHFEAAGFHVFNCNPDSGLKAFPYISFDEAVNEARLPIDVKAERTEGLYDRAKPKVEIKWAVSTPKPGACIVVAADSRQEDILQWWYGNLRRYHKDIPVVFGDMGMTSAGREWCQSRGTLVSIGKPNAKHAWFGKPIAILQGTHEVIVWMDVDTEIRRPIDALWTQYVPSRGVAIAPDLPWARRGISNGGNSGVVVCRHGEKLIVEWATRCMDTDLRGDQDVLYAMGVRPTLPQRFNWLRLTDGPVPDDVAVYHWTSQAGKKHIRAAIRGAS